jgi:hypothetical protein
LVDLLIDRINGFGGLLNGLVAGVDHLMRTVIAKGVSETDGQCDDDEILHDSISLFELEGRMIPPNEYSLSVSKMQGVFLLTSYLPLTSIGMAL